MGFCQSDIYEITATSIRLCTFKFVLQVFDRFSCVVQIRNRSAKGSRRTVGVCKSSSTSHRSLSQLLMIRSKPGFLDRLVTRLQDMRNQVERSRRRVAEAQMQINEATAEQERQAAVLLKHRSDCKQLVTLVS
ncbi:unnamed protein product [Echinostoma caproni]|uniref:Vps5 domain-containing protein n=1 Tax=Echinostoma caproni TaxID=27848 RepID=A0A183AYJ3_9TREM|nr:unnamed protein product [Echinostoma caproni]